MKTKITHNQPYILRSIISYIIASFFSFSIFYLISGKKLYKLQLMLTNTNIFLFVLSIVLFCLFFLIIFLSMPKLIKNITLKNHILSKTNSNLIIILFFLFFIWITRIVLTNASKILAYKPMNPFSKMQIVSLLITYFLIFIFRKFLFKKIKIFNNKIFWIIMALLTASAVAFCFYAPNGLYPRNDYDAYYNSIYIHQQGIPYSEHFNSIYGHYAIFYRLIFKLININPYTIASSTALIGFISTLCIIYVIYSFIKTPFLRLLGLGTLAFPFVGFLPVFYPQTFPHRLFFPSIIMALGTYLAKNTKAKRKILLIIGYITSILAIIWSNDTGIVCLVAWGSLHTYFLFSQNKFKTIDLLKFFIPLTSIFISFMSAWKTTNIYNIALGGKNMTLYYFLYPILETKYIDIIRINIPLFFSYWMLALLLFYLFLSQGIASMSFCIKKVHFNKQIALGLLISVLGIGQLMYYINRCVYFNLLLCYYPTIVLILFVSENTKSSLLQKKKNILNNINTGFFYCSLSILVILVFRLSINIKPEISFMKTFNNMDSLKDMTAYIKSIAPKDTPIVSIDTPSLGIALGWKNELGFLDLTDLFLKKNEDYIMNKLANYGKPFLIEKKYFERFTTVQELPEFNGLKKIKEEYDIKELTEMNKIWYKAYSTSYDKSVLLFLTPKKK